MTDHGQDVWAQSIGQEQAHKVFERSRETEKQQQKGGIARRNAKVAVSFNEFFFAIYMRRSMDESQRSLRIKISVAHFCIWFFGPNGETELTNCVDQSSFLRETVTQECVFEIAEQYANGPKARHHHNARCATINRDKCIFISCISRVCTG